MKEEEQNKLIKALILTVIIIFTLCIVSIFFASLISEPPSYNEIELEEIISILDNSIYTLNKEQKAKVETFFNLENMRTIEFKRNEIGLDVIISDGRTNYIFPFNKESNKLLFKREEDTIMLFVKDSTLLFYDGYENILELGG